MVHFPVSNSNLSDIHLEPFLQEKYSLSKETKCRLIRSGINDSYLVTDNLQKYIFRVYSYNWRTKTAISEEIKLLNQLWENNIAVSYPLPDIESNYIQTLNAPEGERFAVLFSYAEGQKLHSFPEDIHFKIGELMAQLHTVVVNQSINRVTYTPEIILIDSLKQIIKFLGQNTEEMHLLQSTQKTLLNELLNADVSTIRKGIVHLDIWFENLNITEDNKVTIFDFDFCGNGWLCYDIAFYIMQVYNVERYDEQKYIPKVESFLKGYESLVKISEEEKRLIPVFGVSLYYFYLGIQCQRFHNWSNSFLSEDYLKRYVNGIVKRYFDINKLA